MQSSECIRKKEKSVIKIILFILCVCLLYFSDGPESVCLSIYVFLFSIRSVATLVSTKFFVKSATPLQSERNEQTTRLFFYQVKCTLVYASEQASVCSTSTRQRVRSFEDPAKRAIQLNPGESNSPAIFSHPVTAFSC